ncbi:hypothetical protein PLICRDRAFT_159865 [Plicaturopsis crispa FD-325 SS-3]|nr:hypothetical protein PLICRDRAFT_159865 [Plicaturopsis crispa FD-325 SS-3]
MPKARKKSTPITSQTAPGSSSSKPQSSRTVIRAFHVLIKRQAQLQSQRQDATTAKQLADVEEEIERLGGLSAYQRMSSIGQGNDRGGGSEKVLIAWLRDIGVADRVGKPKLRLLEVGALKHDNYAACSAWIEATPIDLRSRHPSIAEQDFLLMDPLEHHETWDIISLSLVVNFVPDPAQRGRMLSLAYKMIRPSGLLFLALPLPCVQNSRYLTFEHLTLLMKALGFEELKVKWKKGGKMAYWLYRRTDAAHNASTEPFRKKIVFRQGSRNNFAIVL